MHDIIQFEMTIPELGELGGSGAGGRVNRESIKNHVVCETNVASIETRMRCLEIKWDMPIDSVNNTPMHVVVIADYMNLPLLAAIPDETIKRHFFSNANSLNLNPFSYLVANWKWVPQNEEKLYEQQLERVVSLTPADYFKPNSLIIHMCIQTSNIFMLKLMRKHPNYEHFNKICIGAAKTSPIEHLRKHIELVGVTETNYKLFMEIAEILVSDMPDDS